MSDPDDGKGDGEASAPRSPGRWRWAAPGAVLLDGSGHVRKIFLLTLDVDDLAIQRTKPLLLSLGRRLVVESPALCCDTGRQLTREIDRWIEKWHAR
ncbi:MAG TPA: hypothetical protein VFF06_14035 [Polyangia bacterium]|nr:hypothetical protein [Polyangia bacterium]